MAEVDQKDTVFRTLEPEEKTETSKSQEGQANSLDLQQVKGSRNLAASLAGQNGEQIPRGGAALGDLTIDGARDGKKRRMNSIESHNQAIANEKFEKQEVYVGRNKEFSVESLSRIESLILKGLTDAVYSGNILNVQEMLRTLNESPKSSDRVLKAFACDLLSRNSLNSLSWEQGKDNQGNSFICLQLAQSNSRAKSSGETRLFVASDGQVSADYSRCYQDIRRTVRTEYALRLITNAQEPEEEDFRVPPGYMLPLDVNIPSTLKK